MWVDKNVLTVNAGSSSIKLNVFAVSQEDAKTTRILDASVTGIGLPTSTLVVHTASGDTQTQQLTVADQAVAVDALMLWLTKAIPTGTIMAIGHRIVHGGPNYSQPQLITDELERTLQSFAAYDPEHAPAALHLIHTLRRRFPDVPQVACFDTAFFHDLPRVAQLLPLPREYQAMGLRRYGFHGLSYTYLLQAFGAAAGETAANGRIIFAHMGSGVSLAAVHGGKPVDTTMGFTPTSGVVMSSRSGDLDPGVLSYLHVQTGMTIEQYGHMVNFESGLLGVSGLSADMYTLLQRESADEHAAEAVELFVYQIKKAIGALATTLGGLDSLIFAGGIGEQSSVLRGRIADGLGFLGIQLDAASNERHDELISAKGSQVGVHVLPTDEAHIISEQVIQVVNDRSKVHH